MQFDVHASTTVTIAGLQVQLPTLGRNHTFRFAGHDCSVVLPGAEKIGPLERVRREESLADGPDDVEHTWYGVYQAAVLVVLPEPVEHLGDESTFNSPELAMSDWGRVVRRDIPPLIAGAFDHWLRVIRCATVSSVVRLSDDGGSSFTGGFRIYRSSDQKLYTGHGGTAFLQGSLKVSTTEWDDLQRLFEADYIPTLWLDYLTDGMHRLRNEDLSGAIVSTVIACETVIRALFWQSVPEITNEVARQVIDNASVQALLDRLDRLTGLPKAEWKVVGKSEVHQLFEARNALVHRGDISDLDKATVVRLLAAAKQFVVKADGVFQTSETSRTCTAPDIR